MSESLIANFPVGNTGGFSLENCEILNISSSTNRNLTINFSIPHDLYYVYFMSLLPLADSETPITTTFASFIQSAQTVHIANNYIITTGVAIAASTSSIAITHKNQSYIPYITYMAIGF